MFTAYSKVGRTETYVWRDYDDNAKNPVAPFVPVVLWPDSVPSSDPIFGAHQAVTMPRHDNAAFWSTAGSGGNAVSACRLPIIGVTQGIAIHGQQVTVMTEGVTRLIVGGEVLPGDELVLAYKTVDAVNRKFILDTMHPLFRNVPELRPLVHPYWGRAVAFVAARVLPLRVVNQRRGSPSFSINAFSYTFGIALQGTGASNPDDELRLISVRLTPPQRIY
jgi:hypothetical protein